MSPRAGGRGAVFREDALRSYAAGRRRGEDLQDVSARLLVGLALCAALLGGALIVVSVCVALMLR